MMNLSRLFYKAMQHIGQSYPENTAQQYGQYPQPMHTEQKGPIENLLSGLLSGGQHQQQQQPQFGGGPSIGGLGSMSGLLENFAGQLFHSK